MRLNIEKIKELIKKKYRNNIAFFADEIGAERSYFTRILGGKVKSDSALICNKIIVYCEKENLDYKDYIFLD